MNTARLLGPIQYATHAQPRTVVTPQSRDVLPQVNRFVRTLGRAHLMPDLAERHKLGSQRHGGPLTTFNGHNTLADQYQEALDGIFYATQYYMETGSDYAHELMCRWVGMADSIRREVEQAAAAEVQALTGEVVP